MIGAFAITFDVSWRATNCHDDQVRFNFGDAGTLCHGPATLWPHTPAAEWRSGRNSVGLARGGLGGLAAWHLPGGPFGPASRWAATSNNLLLKQKKGRDGVRDKVTKRRTRKEGVECGRVLV